MTTERPLKKLHNVLPELEGRTKVSPHVIINTAVDRIRSMSARVASLEKYASELESKLAAAKKNPLEEELSKLLTNTNFSEAIYQITLERPHREDWTVRLAVRNKPLQTVVGTRNPFFGGFSVEAHEYAPSAASVLLKEKKGYNLEETLKNLSMSVALPLPR